MNAKTVTTDETAKPSTQWRAILAIVAFIILVVWFIFRNGGNEETFKPTQPQKYPEKLTFTAIGRVLERQGWTFGENKLLDKLYSVSYSKKIGDFNLSASISAVGKKPPSTITVLISGTYDAQVGYKDSYHFCEYTVCRLSPHFQKALHRAILAQKDYSSGIPRKEGVSTTADGWRLQVIDYEKVSPARENNPFMIIMLTKPAE